MPRVVRRGQYTQMIPGWQVRHAPRQPARALERCAATAIAPVRAGTVATH
jgi:hypothetical protein